MENPYKSFSIEFVEKTMESSFLSSSFGMTLLIFTEKLYEKRAMRIHINENDQTRRQKADNIYMKIEVTVPDADENQNPDENQGSVQQNHGGLVGSGTQKLQNQAHDE